MSSSERSADFADLTIPPAIEALAVDVEELGGRTWLVGGGVRDHLLGYEVKDVDVEVHGVPTQDLERLLTRLGRVNAVGRSFGVFKLRPRGSRPDQPELDISIPRRDSNAGPGHKGIAVEGDPWMSLDEAVSRRDLTINALMVDVRTRQLCDRVGGLVDLRAGRLRAVDRTTFLDDPLRALRVVQFAARTGFMPDDELLDLCRRAPLDELPPERVQLEWDKLLRKGTHLPLGLQIARHTEVLSRVFPERVDAPDLDEALQRCLPARDALEASGPAWTLLLVVWLSQTPLAAAETTLDRLCMHTVARYPVRRQVLAQLAHLQDPTDTDADLRHLSVHVELRIALAARAALHPSQDVGPARERATTLGILTEKPAPLLQGRDLAALGMRPGRAMGALLQEAYRAQLDGLLTQREQAMEWAQERL